MFIVIVFVIVGPLTTTFRLWSQPIILYLDDIGQIIKQTQGPVYTS